MISKINIKSYQKRNKKFRDKKMRKLKNSGEELMK